MTAIDKLIEHFGNITQAAIALGEARQTVQAWVKAGYIPYRQGKNIEAATGKKIKAIEVWECAAKARHH